MNSDGHWSSLQASSRIQRILSGTPSCQHPPAGMPHLALTKRSGCLKIIWMQRKSNSCISGGSEMRTHQSKNTWWWRFPLFPLKSTIQVSVSTLLFTVSSATHCFPGQGTIMYPTMKATKVGGGTWTRAIPGQLADSCGGVPHLDRHDLEVLFPRIKCTLNSGRTNMMNMRNQHQIHQSEVTQQQSQN